MNTIGATVPAIDSIATDNYLALALMGVHDATSIYFNQKQIDLEQRIENESLALSLNKQE